MDALLDDSISLITCFGKAGTGKTLLSTACALQQIFEEGNRYDGLSISRPVITLGKDIGFLPGSLEEKMKPWLQPYYDALEVLMPSKLPKEPQFASKKVGKKFKKKEAFAAALHSAPPPSMDAASRPASRECTSASSGAGPGQPEAMKDSATRPKNRAFGERRRIAMLR